MWSARPNRLRTLARLVQELGRLFGDSGFSVAVDRLFSGCLVPTVCDEREPAVACVMIELNRTLYMDQASAAKRPEPLGLFDTTMLYFVPPLTVVRRAEVTDARSSGWRLEMSRGGVDADERARRGRHAAWPSLDSLRSPKDHQW